MEQNKCRICGNPITRGMYCLDCVRKHQQRKQQRQFFGKPAEHPQGMSGEDTKALADLIDKYGISMILRMAGTIVGDRDVVVEIIQERIKALIKKEKGGKVNG